MFNTYFKASSLANAVFTCVLISVFLGCLVLLSHYFNILNKKIEISEQLINTNTTTLDYYISKYQSLEYEIPVIADVLDEGIATTVVKKKWGFYDILSGKTIFKTDTIEKTVMVGYKSYKDLEPALYVTNYDKVLKLSGESTFIGTLKIPKGQLETFYINGQKGNNITVNGAKLSSDSSLPTISKTPEIIVSKYKTTFLDEYDTTQPIFNSFSDETIVIDVSNINSLSNVIIKGNIILYSDNTLNLSANTLLSDIIVYAKSVTIDKNFEGTVHIFAEKEVIVEENAVLKYPSSIYAEQQQAIDSVVINIKDNAKIAGGIIVNSSFRDNRKNMLVIGNGASVYGTVFCNGKAQLNGKVYGNLYTDRFFLKTQTAYYENIIRNGTVDGTGLPEEFIKIPLLKSNTENGTYKVVKNL